MPPPVNRVGPAFKRLGPALVGMAIWVGATAAMWSPRRHGGGKLRSSLREPSLFVTGAATALIAGLLLVAAFLAFGPRAIALQGWADHPAQALMIRYGCAGCHTIPGVPGARGQAGPSLDGFAGRLYVGGTATNNSANLVRWLVNPRAIDPRTAMPVTGISEAEARSVADYLLSR
jgi:cytochrome c1